VFEFRPERIEEIRQEVDKLGKNTYHFEADLLDENKIAVARVTREVYVRAKTRSAEQ